MQNQPYPVADIIGILVAMMIVLLYYRNAIRSFFEDKLFLCLSAIAIATISFLFFMVFKYLGY